MRKVVTGAGRIWGLEIGTIEIGLGGNGRVTLLQVRYAGEVTG